VCAYVPAGWPDGVSPPGSEDLGTTAVAWLLDEVIPEYRMQPVACRYPLVLITIARHVVDGALEGTRAGYRVARTELGEAVPPHAVDAALKAYNIEGHRLARAAKAVRVVQQALLDQQGRPQS